MSEHVKKAVHAACAVDGKTVAAAGGAGAVLGALRAVLDGKDFVATLGAAASAGLACAAVGAAVSLLCQRPDRVDPA
jgi:hypothetical protein